MEKNREDGCWNVFAVLAVKEGEDNRPGTEVSKENSTATLSSNNILCLMLLASLSKEGSNGSLGAEVVRSVKDLAH